MSAIVDLPTSRSSTELMELAREVSGPAVAPFGAYVFGPGDRGADLARSLEAEVFYQAFGNTPELLATEYGPYADTSLYVVILDHRRMTTAGMGRLILPSIGGPGLKSVNDLVPTWCADPREMLSGELAGVLGPRTLDFATLAVAPAYRTVSGLGFVSLGLYQTVARIFTMLEAEYLVALLDRPVYVMSRRRYLRPFVPYGPAAPYLGSAGSLPVYLQIADWSERLRLVDPDLWNVIFDGHGIEPALDPASPLSIAAAVDELPATVTLTCRPPQHDRSVISLMDSRPQHGAGLGRATALEALAS